jgi:hypothetical protein
LHIPSVDAIASGYAGDIAAGPGGGFVLSGQRVGKGVLWHPDAPEQLFSVAELKEICALSTPTSGSRDGILMGSESGVAHWHPRNKARMLAWPSALTLDNHWTILSNG